MLSEVDFTQFYRAGISVEPQLATDIPQTLCATFHQQMEVKSLKIAVDSHSVTK